MVENFLNVLEFGIARIEGIKHGIRKPVLPGTECEFIKTSLKIVENQTKVKLGENLKVMK